MLPKIMCFHYLVSNNNNNYNGPFWPVRIAVNLTIFKTRLLGIGFHTLIRNAPFPSRIDMRSYNPPLLEANVLPSFDTIYNNSNSPLADIVYFGPLHTIVSLHSF